MAGNTRSIHCPWCGSPTRIEGDGIKAKLCWVECVNDACGVSGPGARNKVEAARLWNMGARQVREAMAGKEDAA